MNIKKGIQPVQQALTDSVKVLRPTQLFQRRSSQPISWHSTEETKPNTTKANNTRTK